MRHFQCKVGHETFADKLSTPSCLYLRGGIFFQCFLFEGLHEALTCRVTTPVRLDLDDRNRGR